MDKQHYDEMLSAINEPDTQKSLEEKKIFVFGHCNATEELVDLLLSRGYRPVAILDNNRNKHGVFYKGISVVSPERLMCEDQENTIVCIVARAYAAMVDQLKRLGYRGAVRKIVDYNSFSEYSLHAETVVRMRARAERGVVAFNKLEKKYSDAFFVLCPFSALGDIYFCMSYLGHFLKKRAIDKYVVCVIGKACGQVVKLFDNCPVEVLSQRDMDEVIQGALYLQVNNIFIPHQDRPYVVNLHKALYKKCIPLEQIYCCGVFGLSPDVAPIVPQYFSEYTETEGVVEGKTVILSPYAKSVTALKDSVWEQIVDYYQKKGYVLFTNVVGDEVPLSGTKAIRPRIAELKSLVEKAGTFIGIRSGLCDVLQSAAADMTALYPDYCYCDTKWKAIDMYNISGWKNLVVKDDFIWEKN